MPPKFLQKLVISGRTCRFLFCVLIQFSIRMQTICSNIDLLIILTSFQFRSSFPFSLECRVKYYSSSFNLQSLANLRLKSYLIGFYVNIRSVHLIWNRTHTTAARGEYTNILYTNKGLYFRTRYLRNIAYQAKRKYMNKKTMWSTKFKKNISFLEN